MPAPDSLPLPPLADGEVLPGPHCTPGAVDQAVSQANIEQTFCRPGGYNDSVGPPQEMTEPLKHDMATTGTRLTLR